MICNEEKEEKKTGMLREMIELKLLPFYYRIFNGQDMTPMNGDKY